MCALDERLRRGQRDDCLRKACSLLLGTRWTALEREICRFEAARREWEASPALREEFGGRYESWLAYSKAEARGFAAESQAPDWVDVVDIKKQALADARAAVDESCKRSTHLTKLSEEGVVKVLLIGERMTRVADKKIRKEVEVAHQDLRSKVGRVLRAAEQANAECLGAWEELEEEKARYEQLGRILESLAPPSINVDVYHHY